MISHTGLGDSSTPLTLTAHDSAQADVSPSVFPAHRIGSSPAEEFSRPTFAAGALLWRAAADTDTDTATSTTDQNTAATEAQNTAATSAHIEIAVVHRPHYDDWSLPKGKVDPGENLPTVACREIYEETGYRAQLGHLVGYVHYPLKTRTKTRTKVVYYWTAQVTGGEFQPNNEVDELLWLPAEQALERVSYDLDREVIQRGIEAVALGADRRIVLVRHAKAHSRKQWFGDDNLRPLSKKGVRQAAGLVSVAQSYGVDRVISAEPMRCISTAEPMAQALDQEIVCDSRVGDLAFDSDPDTTMNALREILAESAPGSATAVVSQGLCIPGVLERFFQERGVVIEELLVKKGSAWVLHFSGEMLVGADYLASALPVK